MKILITGGCGFVGSNLSLFLKNKGFKVYSLDNLYRKGSRINFLRLKKKGIKNFIVDISEKNKILNLPKFDLIIDCCAEASVESSHKDLSRVFDTNLIGTKNILLKCIKDKSKIIYMSSSRVYSLIELNNLVNFKNKNSIKTSKEINLNFSVQSPKTLYGFSKHASEELIKEFSFIYDVKFIINRCGVISGPWQFGKVDQGFFSLFVWKALNNKVIKLIGFGGYGNQVRDILHIKDLSNLIYLQIKNFYKKKNMTFAVGGGRKNAISLIKLIKLVEKKLDIKIYTQKVKKTSKYDIPYFVSSNKDVTKTYNWKPKENLEAILDDTIIWMNKNRLKLKKYFK